MAERRILNPIIYCGDCKIEAVETESGLLCPTCGAYLTDDELESLAS